MVDMGEALPLGVKDLLPETDRMVGDLVHLLWEIEVVQESGNVVHLGVDTDTMMGTMIESADDQEVQNVASSLMRIVVDIESVIATRTLNTFAKP